MSKINRKRKTMIVTISIFAVLVIFIFFVPFIKDKFFIYSPDNPECGELWDGGQSCYSVVEKNVTIFQWLRMDKQSDGFSSLRDTRGLLP